MKKPTKCRLIFSEMVRICRILCLAGVFMFLGNDPAACAAEGEAQQTSVKPWSIDLKVLNYFKSHTSYEFGNPDPPGQVPLSRLEFPMNSWWAGVEVRRNIGRVSLGVEILRNISAEANGLFKDSDWDNDKDPTTRTIYSESNCRMEPSYNFRAEVDMQTSDWLKLPTRLELRPVVGFRWQRLSFVAHDGVQTEFSPTKGTTTVVALPGDVIRFEQTYWHYFFGLKTAYDLGRPMNLPRLKLHGQVDWAYVVGSNQDQHLLRGYRFTYEKTTGDAWHGTIGLKMEMTGSISAGAAFDYLRIQTKGSHRMVDGSVPFVMAWDNGVRVWSEQMNLMLYLEYAF